MTVVNQLTTADWGLVFVKGLWVKRQPIRNDYCSAVVVVTQAGIQWRNQLAPVRPEDEINLRLVINQYGWIYKRQQMQSAIGY